MAAIGRVRSQTGSVTGVRSINGRAGSDGTGVGATGSGSGFGTGAGEGGDGRSGVTTGESTSGEGPDTGPVGCDGLEPCCATTPPEPHQPGTCTQHAGTEYKSHG